MVIYLNYPSLHSCEIVWFMRIGKIGFVICIATRAVSTLLQSARNFPLNRANSGWIQQCSVQESPSRCVLRREWEVREVARATICIHWVM